jgi:hypothetical protein
LNCINRRCQKEKRLILRSPRSGRLEGRTISMQADIEP